MQPRVVHTMTGAPSATQSYRFSAGVPLMSTARYGEP